MESIGIDYKILIIQIVNFLILFGVLSWLVYKPIVGLLESRRKKITDSLVLADKTKKEAEELAISNQEKINKIKEEAKKIIDDSRISVELDAKKIREKAQDDARKIIENGKLETEADRQKMILSLKQELAELILLASDKLTKKTVKPEIQKKLVDEVIQDLKNQKISTL